MLTTFSFILQEN